MRRIRREKDHRTNMTNEEDYHPTNRRRCGTGRPRRAREGILEEGCQPEEGRAQSQENRQGGPAKAAGQGEEGTQGRTRQGQRPTRRE